MEINLLKLWKPIKYSRMKHFCFQPHVAAIVCYCFHSHGIKRYGVKIDALVPPDSIKDCSIIEKTLKSQFGTMMLQ